MTIHLSHGTSLSGSPITQIQITEYVDVPVNRDGQDMSPVPLQIRDRCHLYKATEL